MARYSRADLLDGADWRCIATDPGVVSNPAELAAIAGEWHRATVPGTVAGAIRDVDGPGPIDIKSLDTMDWWFVTRVATTGEGSWLLHFDGLTAFADVWVDNTLTISSESMFVPGEAIVTRDTTSGREITIAIHFHSMAAVLSSRRPRGRWRSALVREQGLRWIRTTMLGRAAVFSGVPVPVGPWRGIRLLDTHKVGVVSRVLEASVNDDAGQVEITARLSGLPSGVVAVAVVVGAVRGSLAVKPGRDGLSDVTGVVEIPDVDLWWPHTHGVPHRYPVSIEVGGKVFELGNVGFRSLEVDRTAGGFRLSVNDIDVYCRGSLWVPTDPISFQSETLTTQVLERCASAGVNMLRVPGTMVYESDHFWNECARLGILVWQDAMLATLDPPDTAEFFALFSAEIRTFLRRVGGNPALVVFCGGSETEQQPAMLGLVDQKISIIHSQLPSLIADLAPHVEYVTSSPSAPPEREELVTHVGSGIAHYFGVGAYRRPLDDVTRARVRFAAECLAFAIPPSNNVIESAFGSVSAAGHHPAWKASVPRDNGSSWDFEDVRDHYVKTLFGEDPSEVRWSDPERYLDLGRAAICEAFGAVLGHWRRADSGCDGALTLALMDLEPGPGWGVLDWQGTPKAPWYVLRRYSKPLALIVTDDGMDGLRLDVLNETAQPVVGEIRIRAHSRSGIVPVNAVAAVRIEAHGSQSLSVDTVVGRFTDLTHVFKFGPANYDAVTVTLENSEGMVLDEVVHLLGSVARPLERSLGLSAIARSLGEEEWVVDVTSEGTAQYVSLDLQGFDPEDSWFHLAPGGSRTVRLRRVGQAKMVIGRVRALNSHASVAVAPPTVADPPRVSTPKRVPRR
ncbi:glycosyl hydrolase [Rhodococcus sp. SRB_17]|nr:glycosyl hydrolase [Rhodococcus sp. SRB_17]